MGYVRSLIGAVALAGFAAGVANAATITLKDVGDGKLDTTSSVTTIRSDSANTNDYVSGYTTLLVGKQSTRDFRGLLNFNLSSVEALAGADQTVQITGITLTLYIADIRNAVTGMTFTVSSYLTDPTKATWNDPDSTYGTQTAGGTPGATLSTLAVPTGASYDGTAVGNAYVAASTDAFVAEANNALAGNNIISMMLWNTASGTNFARFGEDTYADSTLRPVLTVDYELTSVAVPEVASIGAMILGGAILMLSRRR